LQYHPENAITMRKISQMPFNRPQFDQDKKNSPEPRIYNLNKPRMEAQLRKFSQFRKRAMIIFISQFIQNLLQ
jgi:hypothetical protein